MPNENIQHVVVVGGGTAGWITAGILAAKCVKEEGRELKITLIESPSIGTVGVGEGTWPSLRTTLQTLGVSETDFIRECDATFKQGAQFKRWVDNTPSDSYFHPLMLPINPGPNNTLLYWLNHVNGTRPDALSFSKALCPQEAACEHGLAPKAITTPEYQGVLNYAYHLDTNKFAVFIKKHCIANLNIHHIENDILGVTPNEDGSIQSLRLANDTALAADFFIDCSGMTGLLIDKHFNIPFIDKSDILFCNSAIAAQCPYPNEGDRPIASHTISTATDAGWIWDIGLQNRRGTGHVYSSEYMSDTDAEQVLRNYLGKSAEQLDFRNIRYTPGHREKFWAMNCVAVGLSAGFVEPLEASSILLAEISAYWIADKLPRKKNGLARCEKQFNDVFRYRWDSIIEFLKLHYCISKRTDTRFWRDNTHAKSIPTDLLDKLAMWREQSPSVVDFLNRADVFPLESYQYILYGMKFDTATIPVPESHLIKVGNKINKQQMHLDNLLSTLPNNRQLIAKIREFGLQKI